MRIEYDNGVMNIDLDVFFPASVKDTRKLLGVIRISYNPIAGKEEVLQHLTDRLKEITEYGDECSRQAGIHLTAREKSKKKIGTILSS